MLDAKVKITRRKLLVFGDTGVGKTSLIRSFKEGKFQEEWDETGEVMECKMVHEGERMTLYQMIELHDGDVIPPEASSPDAILLLYDADSGQNRHEIQTEWYSKINLRYSAVPLFLIRTKVERQLSETSNYGACLASSIHATRFFECSAKLMNGIKYIFIEINRILRDKQIRKNDIVKVAEAEQSTVGCVVSLLGNSGPLLRQAYTNVRECFTNPNAFTSEKKSIQSMLPFLDFGISCSKTTDDIIERLETADCIGEREQRKEEKERKREGKKEKKDGQKEKIGVKEEKKEAKDEMKEMKEEKKEVKEEKKDVKEEKNDVEEENQEVKEEKKEVKEEKKEELNDTRVREKEDKYDAEKTQEESKEALDGKEEKEKSVGEREEQSGSKEETEKKEDKSKEKAY